MSTLKSFSEFRNSVEHLINEGKKGRFNLLSPDAHELLKNIYDAGEYLKQPFRIEYLTKQNNKSIAELNKYGLIIKHIYPKFTNGIQLELTKDGKILAKEMYYRGVVKQTV